MTTSELKRLLIPVRLRERKARYGNRLQDGGYVLLPSEISRAQVVYSHGVGKLESEIAFDIEMAEMGKIVCMFDGTIDRPYVAHPNFRFIRENIHSRNIWRFVEYFRHDDMCDLTAQIDIEGCEYEALGNCDERFFGVFSQISLELHDLHAPTAQMAKTLSRLNEFYHIFHIVANNWEIAKLREPLIEGLPNVIEISLLRKDRLSYSPEVEPLGSPQPPLDVPNNPRLPFLNINWWQA